MRSLLLLGRSGIVTQSLNAWGIPFGSIYGTPGIVAVYTLTLYPYVLLPTVAGLKAVDHLRRGGGPEPRLLAGAHVPDCHAADRHPLRAFRRAAGLHRDDREFRRAGGAGRGQADPRGRGLQALHRRDGDQPVGGRRTGRAADRVDGDGADHPAALSGEPALCDRRARRPAADQDRRRLAHRLRPPIAGRSCCWRWCRSLPSSCCRSWSSADRCCTPPSA